VVAENFLERQKEGEDFAALAANYSTDASAANGGDIGWIRKGQTIEPFQTAAFNLTVGQISGVVKTAAGYHVIQLLGQRNQSIP
jgi:parvulin-like peptidyl-prolyl isomerase